MNAMEAKELSNKNKSGYDHEISRIILRIYDIIRQKALIGHTSTSINIENEWHKGVIEILTNEGYSVVVSNNDKLNVVW